MGFYIRIVSALTKNLFDKPTEVPPFALVTLRAFDYERKGEQFLLERKPAVLFLELARIYGTDGGFLLKN